jgi:hypothetical protein
MSDLEQTVRALEERVRHLEDTLAITALVGRYGPAVDSGSDREAADLWTETGVYDLGFRVIEGSSKVAEMVRGEHHQGLIHSGAAHVLGAPLVRVDGDRAVATCYSNVFRYVDGAFEVWRTAVNRWELERTADGWHATRRTTRLLDGSDDARELLRRAVAPE